MPEAEPHDTVDLLEGLVARNAALFERHQALEEELRTVSEELEACERQSGSVHAVLSADAA